MKSSYRHEVIKPDELLEVKLFAFKADSYERIIAPHWHASVEILYCIEGQLVVHAEMNQYLLERGDMMLLNSNVVHSTNSPIKNHILVIQLPLKFMQKVTENHYNQQYVFELNSAKNPAGAELNNCLAKMIVEAQDETTEGRLATKIAVYQLMLSLLNHHKQPLDDQIRLKTVENQKKLVEIVNYIKGNYQTDLSLTAVASHFNYSRTYFSKFFKKNMGTNFSDYLNLIRIEHAQNLLIHSEWTILDIAISSGFNNVRTFFGAFEKYHQMSPSEFRKKRK